MRKSKYFEKPIKVEAEDKAIMQRLTALRDRTRTEMGVVADDVRRVSLRPYSVDAKTTGKVWMLMETIQALRHLEKLLEVESVSFAPCVDAAVEQ